MKDEQLIDAYIKLRDRRAQRKAAYLADDESDKQYMDKIEALFLKSLNEEGLTSKSCKGVGTAYITTRTSVTAADKEAFMGFIRDGGMWQLLEVRPAKAAVEEYVAANEELPPGLNMRREMAVNIQRA